MGPTATWTQKNNWREGWLHVSLYRSNLGAGVRRNIGYMSQVRGESGNNLPAEKEGEEKKKKKIEMGLLPVASQLLCAEKCGE